jgi:hypothetical protein
MLILLPKNAAAHYVAWISSAVTATCTESLKPAMAGLRAGHPTGFHAT